MRIKAATLYASLLCSILLLSLSSVVAQKPGTPNLQGTYTLENAKAAPGIIKKAINVAVKELRWPVLGIARGRLQKTNLPPYQRIVIQTDACSTEVSITTDQRPPIRTTLDGTPVDWAREDGEKFKVDTICEGGQLKQTFIGKDGQRVNTYSISADGKRLTMQVSVTSPRLRQPLKYQLTYNRAS